MSKDLHPKNCPSQALLKLPVKADNIQNTVPDKAKQSGGAQRAVPSGAKQ